MSSNLCILHIIFKPKFLTPMKNAIPEVKKKPIRTFFASLFAHLAIKKDIRNKKIRLMSHRDLTTKKANI